MNLMSCGNCGVVLDKNRLPFPDTIENEDGCIDPERGAWDGHNYVPYVKCPVCGYQLLDDD